MSSDLCEIRVPTYRRLRLLERALKSLQAQTHANWVCVVFDDCPDGSARAVIEALNDDRIIYNKNPRNLGAIGNIDLCFRKEAYASGNFACILEDDNYFHPNHLETQIGNLKGFGVDFLFCAQQWEDATKPGADGVLTGKKTIAWIYPEGIHDHRVIRSAILFSHAFSNGSAFWRVGCDADLEIGDATNAPGLQETLRVFQIRCPIYVTHESTAVWRSNGPGESYVTLGLSRTIPSLLKMARAKLQHKRDMMAIQRHYLDEVGVAEALGALEAYGDVHRYKIEKALINCGEFVRLTDRPWLSQVGRLFGAAILRRLVPSGVRLGSGFFEGPAGASRKARPQRIGRGG